MLITITLDLKALIMNVHNSQAQRENSHTVLKARKQATVCRKEAQLSVHKASDSARHFSKQCNIYL